MKLWHKIGIGFGLVVAVALMVVYTSLTSSVQQLNLDGGLEDHPDIKAFVAQLEEQDSQEGTSWQYQQVFLQKNSGILGRTYQTVYVLGTLVTARDVGTAGTSDWAVGLKVEQQTWVDGATDLATEPVPTLSDLTFDLSADRNTWVRYEAGTYGAGTDVIPVSVALSKEGVVLCDIGASTVNSALSPNAVATATVQWEGVLELSKGLVQQEEIPIQLISSAEYINNISD